MAAQRRRRPLPEQLDDPLADLGELLKHDPDRVEAFLARLPERERGLVERAVAQVSAAGWRATPDAMAHHLTLGAYKRWAYVKLLGAKFVDAVEGRSTRQIWNMPARYGKSLLASQWGPVWMLDRYPERKIALVSYGDDLANENSSNVLGLIREHREHLRVELRRDRQRLDRFVTSEGGGLMAAGIGSGLTGFGAHGIVEDDPFKNWQEAHSEARRLVVVNHYRSVVRLRLETDASFIIIVMTRWHEDDLAGVMEAADVEGEGEGWEVVRLPALAELPSTNPADPPSQRQPDPLGRAPGEPLEPERFSLDSVLARSVAIGSYLTAGMEQQRPAPEEGSEIKRAWWRWYDDRPPRFDDALTSWDMKLKDKETGDYVVGQAWGRTGSDLWGLDQLRGQWNFPTTIAAIALMQVRHPTIRRHVIENTGNGPEVMAELRKRKPRYVLSVDVRSQLGMTDDEAVEVERLLRRGMTGIVPENVKGSKTVRARAQTPLVEAGNVHLPTGPEWPNTFVNEAAAFPDGAHDDKVDSWSQAMKRLAMSEARVTGPRAAQAATTRRAAPVDGEAPSPTPAPRPSQARQRATVRVGKSRRSLG